MASLKSFTPVMLAGSLVGLGLLALPAAAGPAEREAVRAFIALPLAFACALLAGALVARRIDRRFGMRAISFLAFAVIVVGAGGFGLRGDDDATLDGEPDAVIEVIGEQFRWLIRAPGPDRRFGAAELEAVDQVLAPFGIDASDDSGRDDVVALDGALRLPAESLIELRLRSHDVIHAVSLPELGARGDCVPGETRSIRFRTGAPGTYRILCSELCGLAHYRMTGRVEVLERSRFEQWSGAR